MVSSKIPKQLLKFLKQRKDTAHKLNSLDADVDKILEKLEITNTIEYVKLQNDYGCMLTAEPEAYYSMVIDLLEEKLK